MKFSIVTVSFNQGKFLERAIRSVLAQEAAEIEYIVVDPGSTDDSRTIIERYRDQFAKVIFEKDAGPADGLNRGFAHATGDIFCYLNSDDELEPRALARVAEFFSEQPQTDIVCGHAWIVDDNNSRLRRVWSDPYEIMGVAYGTAIQIQPSTFIRKEAFRRVRGFNVLNKIAWDSELLDDLIQSGARLEIMDQFLSSYRVHMNSITGAALFRERAIEQANTRFERLMGRKQTRLDLLVTLTLFMHRQIRNPRAFFERLIKGGVYGRVVQ